MKCPVLIFEYTDYRKFLKDVYLFHKSSDPKYSYRYFAKRAGYKSASALLEIINGKKNLSHEGIKKFALALALNQGESQFFKTLVLLNQAASTEDRIRFAKEIQKLKLNKGIFLLNEGHYRLFEEWYYTAVFEMVTLSNFREDPEWIASQLVPPITPSQARKAIDVLLSLGLLARGKDKKLVQTEANLSTLDEVSSAILANWHREYLKKASENIDLVDRDKRDISGVYFAYSDKNVKALKELIHKFRKEVLELASKEKDRNSVFQLNLQLFPVSKPSKGDS